MQEESSNSESTFEFVDKRENASGPIVEGDESTRSGNLFSNVAPPSALPSFVPLPQTSGSSSANQTFHPTTFSPVIPADKGSVPSGAATGVPAAAGPASSAATTAPTAAASETTVNQTGLFGWVKDAAVGSTSLLTKVAEKAKNSVDSMITTLDPQMKDFLAASNSELEVIVASDKEIKISPVREAFQSVFGKVNVRGLGADAVGVAAQPVGYDAALQAAWKRIDSVRNNQPAGPIVAVENFIVQVTPDKWYDLGVLVLSDAGRGLVLETYTQMTPVPGLIVTLAQDETPPDYPLAATGLAITIGSLMASNLHVHHSEWHHALTGVSRRDMILLAAKSLANIYKNSIQQ